MTGNDVKKIRKSLGETQKQFAKRLGYSHYQRIVEIEKLGKKKIGKQIEWKLRVLNLARTSS